MPEPTAESEPAGPSPAGPTVVGPDCIAGNALLWPGPSGGVEALQPATAARIAPKEAALSKQDFSDFMTYRVPRVGSLERHEAKPGFMPGVIVLFCEHLTGAAEFGREILQLG